MSYDLEIRSDEMFENYLSSETVKSSIMAQPDTRDNGGHTFIWGDNNRLYLELQMEERGNHPGYGEGAEIDCIAVHVPRAFWDEERAPRYLELCRAIANDLGWELYDCEQGKVL